MTLRYTHHRDPQEALRVRLRELAGSRVRYGYRRLTVLLKREGWQVNAKRIYRLYLEEGLIVRTQKRRERAQRQSVQKSLTLAQRVINTPPLGIYSSHPCTIARSPSLGRLSTETWRNPSQCSRNSEECQIGYVN